MRAHSPTILFRSASVLLHRDHTETLPLPACTHRLRTFIALPRATVSLNRRPIAHASACVTDAAEFAHATARGYVSHTDIRLHARASPSSQGLIAVAPIARRGAGPSPSLHTRCLLRDGVCQPRRALSAPLIRIRIAERFRRHPYASVTSFSVRESNRRTADTRRSDRRSNDRTGTSFEGQIKAVDETGRVESEAAGPFASRAGRARKSERVLSRVR